MKFKIKEYQHKKEIAFALTISADLKSPRKMSAVAVMFWEMFVKPTLENCITSHLAYQKSSEGAR
jgi:hypothetical protein